MLKLKYYYTFKSIKGNQYRVEILEDTDLAIDAKEIPYATNAFTVQYNDVENKLETTVGSGAKFSIVANNTFEYIDLYTANIKQFQVRLIKGDLIRWSGWLDTEYYQEDFSQSSNIDIDLTAADFNVLERIQYLKDDGAAYDGISSFFEVLSNIIKKLGLPFTSIYVGSGTTIPDVTIAANETILHNVYAINRNFYDEDYKALDCRAVLEGILKPFNLVAKQVNNKLFIYDLETITSDSPTFKRYDGTSLQHTATVPISCNNGDLSEIGFASSDSTYSTVGSFNRVKLVYNTFKEPVIGEGNVGEDNVSELFNSIQTTDIRDGKDYSYKTDIYTNTADFNLYNRTTWNSPVMLTPTGEYVQSESPIVGLAVSHLTWSPNTLFASFKKKLPLLINETGRYGLKVDAKVLVINTDNYFTGSSSIQPKNLLTQAHIPFKLYFVEKSEVENLSSGTPVYKKTIKSYDNLELVENGGNPKWVSEIKYGEDIPVTYSKMIFSDWGLQSSIANRWTSNQPILYAYNYTGDRPKPISQSFIIPLPAGSYGELNFYITQGARLYNAVGSGSVDLNAIKWVLLNDIKLSIVDSVTGDEVKLTDVEYNAYINKSYKNDGDDIELIQGVNSELFPNENGAILLKNTSAGSYYFAKVFTKAGATDKLEKLNLRTFISNYITNTPAINCDVDRIFEPISALGYVTYNKYLPNKKLGLYGLTINYEDEISSINTKEIFSDTVNINTIDYEPT